jgi:signal transduction histidine kinase
MIQTISGAIAEVMPLAEAKGIAIVFAQHHQSAICRHDEGRMRQVLINLLSNAQKASSPGGKITVSLDITEPSCGGTLAVIQVADQGPGIPENELQTVFDSFVQSSRVKSGASGTGLGLTISREIVQAHHGRIWALNNRTGGVSLFVSLPFLTETDGSACG